MACLSAHPLSILPRKYGQSSLCGVIFRGALVTEFDEKVCRAPRFFNAFCLQGKPASLLVSPPPRNIEIYGGVVRQTEETFAGGARLSIRRNWMINKITGATLTRGIGKRIRSISRDNALPFDETSLSRGTIFFFFSFLTLFSPSPSNFNRSVVSGDQIPIVHASNTTHRFGRRARVGRVKVIFFSFFFLRSNSDSAI